MKQLSNTAKNSIDSWNQIKDQHRNHKVMTLQDEPRKKTKMYLSTDKLRELNKECGDRATILHTLYVNLAEETCVELSDEYIANAIGWSTRTVAKFRLVLEKANWYRKYTGSWGNRGQFNATYYLLDKCTVLSNMSKQDFLDYVVELDLKKETNKDHRWEFV